MSELTRVLRPFLSRRRTATIGTVDATRTPPRGALDPRAIPHRPHRGLGAFAALISLSAWFGTAGLTSGFLDLGPEVTPRLPLHSPVLGGIALALVVAAPMTVLAGLAWTGHRLAPMASVLAGLAQIGWIVVELAFIRELSFFHPLYVLIGVAFVVLGVRALPTADEVVGRS